MLKKLVFGVELVKNFPINLTSLQCLRSGGGLFFIFAIELGIQMLYDTDSVAKPHSTALYFKPIKDRLMKKGCISCNRN
jgi:hypothetical protein